MEEGQRHAFHRGLRCLDGTPRERKVFTFDTETCAEPWNPEQIGPHRFIFGCVYDGTTFWEFADRRRMAKFLVNRRWAGWQGWAVNLEYDLNAIFTEPTWPLWRNYFGGLLKTAQLQVREVDRSRPGRKAGVERECVTLLDTLNHWKGDGEPGKRGGVAAYGRIVGLPKLEMPLDQIGPTVTDTLRTYCRRDAEITWKMVARMQAEYVKLGATLKGSIASTALDLFRRKYLTVAHEHGALRPAFVAQARRAYYGARTENFRVGRFQQIAVGDVNSMYPSIMATQPLPLLVDSRFTHDLPDTGEGFALVDLEVPDTEYPPLPFMWNKLYFPTGRWIGSFVLSELRYAMSVGVKLHRVLGCVHFPASALVLGEYARDLYARRVATQDPVERLAYKTLMNSLYGKFGQSGEVIRFCPSWDEAGTPTPLGWRVERAPGKPAGYANMLWAAYITAGARIRLHQLLTTYEAIYCDTDSVMTTRPVEACGDLGALNLKYVAEWVEIRAPKVYATDRETHIKGVRGAHGLAPDGRFTFRKPTRFRESVRRGIQPNTWGDVERVLQYASDKRCFAADGTSRPLSVEEVMRRRRVRVSISPLVPADPEGKSRASPLIEALDRDGRSL